MLRGGGETGDTREIQNLVGLCPVWVRLPPAALMRPRVEKEAALFLAGGGVNPCQISRLTHIPRTTIRDWLKPRYQHRPRRTRVALDLKSIPRAEYSYLLGFYLGDGCLSLGPKGVYRLRIKTDSRYPSIIEECAAAMQAVMPTNRVRIQKMRYRAVEIGCFSKAWPLLFPQHGPGRKHERKIELAP